MRRLLIAVLVFVAPLAASAQPVPIVIQPLEATNVPPQVGSQIGSFLAAYVAEYGELAVLDQSRINDVLDEQEFALSGLSSEQVVEVGRLINARLILAGSIGRLSADEYLMSLRLLDVSDGTTISVRLEQFDDLSAGIRSLPQVITELFAPVVDLAPREIQEREEAPELAQIERAAWSYPRAWVKAGMVYSIESRTYGEQTFDAGAIGASVGGVFGSSFLFAIDSKIMYPLFVRLGDTAFDTGSGMVNRIAVDSDLLVGYRIHFSSELALVAGIGGNFRQSFLSERTSLFSDGNQSDYFSGDYVDLRVGLSTMLYAEYYLTQNLAIQLGAGVVIDIAEISNSLASAAPSAFTSGVRVAPSIAVTINQLDFRESP